MKKIIILISLLLTSLFIGNLIKVNAVECDTNINLSALTPEQLTEFQNKCQSILSSLGQKASSLSRQIQYMDTQISLTLAQIEQTKQKIIDTQKEIDILGTRINGLDQSLDYLSKLMIQKIVESYKQRATSLFALLFDTNNATDLLTQIKYVKTTRDNDQKLLVQVQETKSNYEDQKKLREEKTVELNKLQATLENQQADLKNQQDAERNILAETQNSESVYENLIQKAQQELAGFTSFATAAGGGLTTFGSGSNGWYYTQRDPQWGNIILPGSSSSVMLAGCAVTSVAMVCKSYGQSITPATIAYNSSNFIGGDLWNWAFGCSGKTTDWIGSSEDAVKSYVNSGTPVILRLYAPSVSGLHFVVAWKWDGNDFIIHDPYYGPDKKFSERYSWSQVTTAIAIH